MLLVESAQSMANRLETVCWDEASNSLVAELEGLPYVAVVDEKGEILTNSILEAHRLNSPYILESADRSFFDLLSKTLNASSGRATDRRLLARTVFKYDPNAVLHGLFLAKKELAGGRFRLVRILSSFVEARDVRAAESGGVKNDRVNPSGDTAKGFGNVPFHRTEFVAGDLRAFFNVDLATLRGYGLGEKAERLLVLVGLWKVRRFLEASMRLRSACDLECIEVRATRPENFELPSLKELSGELPEAIRGCADGLARPAITRVTWKPPKEGAAKRKDAKGKGNGEDEEEEADE